MILLNLNVEDRLYFSAKSAFLILSTAACRVVRDAA